jgi:poly(A) polymerase Pap1
LKKVFILFIYFDLRMIKILPEERIHIRKILEEFIKLQKKYRNFERKSFKKEKTNAKVE